MSQTPDIVERLRDAAKDRAEMERLTPGAYARAPRQQIEWKAADTIEALRSEVTDLQNTIVRLTRELGEARDAFRKYGRHLDDCEDWPVCRCTCGHYAATNTGRTEHD